MVAVVTSGHAKSCLSSKPEVKQDLSKRGFVLSYFVAVKTTIDYTEDYIS